MSSSSSTTTVNYSELCVPLVSFSPTDLCDLLLYLGYEEIALFLRDNSLSGDDLNYVESVNDLQELTTSPTISPSSLLALYNQIGLWKKNGVGRSLVGMAKENVGKRPPVAKTSSSSSSSSTAWKIAPNASASTAIMSATLKLPPSSSSSKAMEVSIDLTEEGSDSATHTTANTARSVTTATTTTANTARSVTTATTTAANTATTAPTSTPTTAKKPLTHQGILQQFIQLLHEDIPAQQMITLDDVEVVSSVVKVQGNYKTLSDLMLRYDVHNLLFYFFISTRQIIQEYHIQLEESEEKLIWERNFYEFCKKCLQLLALMVRQSNSAGLVLVESLHFPAFFTCFTCFKGTEGSGLLTDASMALGFMQVVQGLNKLKSLQVLASLRVIEVLQQVWKLHPQDVELIVTMLAVAHNLVSQAEVCNAQMKIDLSLLVVEVSVLHAQQLKVIEAFTKVFNTMLYGHDTYYFNCELMDAILAIEANPEKKENTLAVKLGDHFVSLIRSHEDQQKLSPSLLQTFNTIFATKQYMQHWLQHDGGMDYLLHLLTKCSTQSLMKAMLLIFIDVTFWYQDTTFSQYEQLCQQLIALIQVHSQSSTEQHMAIMIDIMTCLRNVAIYESFLQPWHAQNGFEAILPWLWKHPHHAKAVEASFRALINLSIHKENQLQLWNLKIYELCLELMHVYGKNIMMLELLCQLLLNAAASQPNIHDFGNIGGYEILLNFIKLYEKEKLANKLMEDVLNLIDDLSESPLLATLLVKHQAFAIISHIPIKSAVIFEITCSILNNLMEKTGIITKYVSMLTEKEQDYEALGQCQLLAIPKLNITQAYRLIENVRLYKSTSTCVDEACHYLALLLSIPHNRKSFQNTQMVVMIAEVMRLYYENVFVMEDIVLILPHCNVNPTGNSTQALMECKCLKYLIKAMSKYRDKNCILKELMIFLCNICLQVEYQMVLNTSTATLAIKKYSLGNRLAVLFNDIFVHWLANDAKDIEMCILLNMSTFLVRFMSRRWMEDFREQGCIKSWIALIGHCKQHVNLLTTLFSVIGCSFVAERSRLTTTTWLIEGLGKVILNVIGDVVVHIQLLQQVLDIFKRCFEENKQLCIHLLGENQSMSIFTLLFEIQQKVPSDAVEVIEVINDIMVMCLEPQQIAEIQQRPAKLRRFAST